VLPSTLREIDDTAFMADAWGMVKFSGSTVAISDGLICRRDSKATVGQSPIFACPYRAVMITSL
jgi:hypothetical protein